MPTARSGEYRPVTTGYAGKGGAGLLVRAVRRGKGACGNCFEGDLSVVSVADVVVNRDGSCLIHADTGRNHFDHNVEVAIWFYYSPHDDLHVGG